MEREVSNGHVSGKNISPFIIGNFSGEILESYSLYMKGTVLYSKNDTTDHSTVERQPIWIIVHF